MPCKSDARSTEMTKPRITIPTIWIHHRDRVRQRFFRQMMIGDDHVEAERVCELDFFHRRDSEIDADQESPPLIVKLLNRFFMNPVAFAESLGLVVSHVFVAEPLKRLQQERARRCSIEIVIGVDDNGFLFFSRGH